MVKVYSRPRRLVALAALALLTSMLVAIPTSASADPPDDLFMSEYVEGSSFNKAIEIYNGTGAAIDLAAGDYQIQIYFNDNTTPGTTINLEGTVADSGVFVVADDGAAAAILGVTDQTSTSNFFNGDDTIVLRKDGVVVDAFGQIGTDPGSQWPGGGADDTLRRKVKVCSGDTNAGDAFDAAVEWDSFAKDMFDGLGNHTADCGGVVDPPVVLINEVDADQVSTDSAEFVELYDGGVGETALDGLSVVLYNGSDDASYLAFDLDGQATDADGYFVLCGDAALVANCDLDVSPDTNLIQNGADAVALVAGDAADYPNDTPVSTTDLVDAIVYDTDDPDDAGLLVLLNAGQPQVNERGGGDGTAHSNQRCPNGDGGERNTDTYAQFAPTPGATNECEPPPPTDACGDPFTTTYAIQGNGLVSPLKDTEVAVEGIVVGDFQFGGSPDNGDLGGFHIQDPTGDGDLATSDGLFIYGSSTDVAVGDAVRVRGQVKEYYELTEVSASQIWVCDSNIELPEAGEPSLPVASVDDLEPFEGMRVVFAQDLYISEYYNYGRYGEIGVAADPQFQPTAVHEPGSPEAAKLAEANELGRIILDDGFAIQNPDPLRHPNGGAFDQTNLLRGGDTLQDLTGVVDYAFGNYKIQPTQAAGYTPSNARTALPVVGGKATVAAFNVLNYFTTLGSRGADTAEEFTRQRDKIFSAMAAIDADVVGLMEIENNEIAVGDLVDGLNDLVGAGTYAYVDTGIIAPDNDPYLADAIKVAFIYKPATVSLVGDYSVLGTDAFVDPMGYGSAKNRPALAQSFMDVDSGGIFTAVVNHLKSKGSSCGAGDDDPEAGSCNLTRTMAAKELAAWLDTDPTESGDEDVLIIGDLNSYDKEDPIDALAAAGYTDLVASYGGEYAYSYEFDGRLGYLDYAMANEALVGEVTGVASWHINADEVRITDYNTEFKSPQQVIDWYAPDAYRSSDHDPVIVGLDVCDEIAPTIEVSVSPDMLWPPNHKYVEVEATVTVADNFDPDPIVTLISVVSNEPDNGPDDGNTVNDIVIVDDLTFELRAERSGIGYGRFYTITYEATDACGNSAVDSAVVYVPLKKGKM